MEKPHPHLYGDVKVDTVQVLGDAVHDASQGRGVKEGHWGMEQSVHKFGVQDVGGGHAARGDSNRPYQQRENCKCKALLLGTQHCRIATADDYQNHYHFRFHY